MAEHDQVGVGVLGGPDQLLDGVPGHHPGGGDHADFYHLPLASGSIDLAVAAFCLYHSPRPGVVIAELASCLANGGQAVIATKSADSCGGPSSRSQASRSTAMATARH